MIKTFKELREIDLMVGSLYQRHPEVINTKFSHYYKKFYDLNMAETSKEYQSEITDARIDHAMVDGEGCIVKDPTDPRGFKFTREGFKQVLYEERKITQKFDERIIEVTPVQFDGFPIHMTEAETEMIKDLFILKDA